MSKHDPSSASDGLQRLRRRLYAPDATAADHARYADELARGGRGEAAGERDGLEAPPVPAAGRGRRLGPLAVASAVALVAGLLIGAGVTLHVTGSTAARPVPSRATPSARFFRAPRPLAAAALGTIAQRRADQQALARVQGLPREEAEAQARVTVGTRMSSQHDRDWPQRVGCSEWIGVRGFSPTGLRSDLRGGAQSPGRAGTHFRIKIFLAKPSGWSWIASGRTADGTTGVVALGAGSSDSGSSQYVEFDAGSPTTITSVDIRSSPSTPFVWEVDSCLPT